MRQSHSIEAMLAGVAFVLALCRPAAGLVDAGQQRLDLASGSEHAASASSAPQRSSAKLVRREAERDAPTVAAAVPAAHGGHHAAAAHHPPKEDTFAKNISDVSPEIRKAAADAKLPTEFNHSHPAELPDSVMAKSKVGRQEQNGTADTAAPVAKGPRICTVNDTRNCTLDPTRGRIPVPVPVEIGDEKTPPAAPAWEVKERAMQGLWSLPSPPASCRTVHGALNGATDGGMHNHVCNTCKDGCTEENMQQPIEAQFTMTPPLVVRHAKDVAVLVELLSVHQLAPYSVNGIHHKMGFAIHRPGGRGFFGSMGPQVRGGTVPGEALNGRHVFEVRDTEMPSPEGKVVEGRWLALPSGRRPGDIGSCKRACVGCEKKPQLKELALSSGTVCTLDVALHNGAALVYRLKQGNVERKVIYDGNTYMGTEWEVSVHDQFSGGSYTMGRIVLEGLGKDSGVIDLSASHEHLGCAPCDAYYQAARVTGPFVLDPPGFFQVEKAEAAFQKSFNEGCNLQRAVSLGGYTMLYESGAGVLPSDVKNSTMFECPSGLFQPEETKAPSEVTSAPTQANSSKTVDAPDATQTAKTVDVPKATKVTKSADVSNTTKVAKSADVSNATKAAKSADASSATKASKTVNKEANNSLLSEDILNSTSSVGEE